MHATMSYVGRKTARILAGHQTGWQDGYYETHIKTAKQFGYAVDYIEHNPVAKGLVELPEQWIASSAYCRDLITDPWPYFYE